MKKTKMTPEQAKEARRLAAKRWYEKQRAAKMALNGGAEPKRGRPKKDAAEKPAKKACAKGCPKGAVNRRGKKPAASKGCKAEKAGLKELKRLEKVLAKARAKYDAAAKKTACAKVFLNEAKAAVKAQKLAVKAQKKAAR